MPNSSARRFALVVALAALPLAACNGDDTCPEPAPASAAAAAAATPDGDRSTGPVATGDGTPPSFSVDDTFRVFVQRLDDDAEARPMAIRWPEATDPDDDLAGYRIQIDGALLADVSTDVRLVHAVAAPGQPVTVEAYDAAGNTSARLRARVVAGRGPDTDDGSGIRPTPRHRALLQRAGAGSARPMGDFASQLQRGDAPQQQIATPEDREARRRLLQREGASVLQRVAPEE